MNALFIDEERWFVEPLIDHAKAEFPTSIIKYAEDGAEAIEIVKQDASLTNVVLDLQLPLFDPDLIAEFDQSKSYPRNLTGLFLLDRIKELRRDLKILCLTNVSDFGVQIMVERAGAKFLSKNEQHVIHDIIYFLKGGK